MSHTHVYISYKSSIYTIEVNKYIYIYRYSKCETYQTLLLLLDLHFFKIVFIYIPIVVIVVSVVANFILIIISHKSIYTIRNSISGCVYWNRKCRISLHFPGCTSIISLFLPTCILHWSSPACPMNGQVVAAAHLKYRIPMVYNNLVIRVSEYIVPNMP